MRRGSVPLFAWLITLGCSGGGQQIGEPCTGNGDCDKSLQCLGEVCVPRCDRAPDCGDGYACDPQGYCQLATGQLGDSCTSEVDCAPGLSCHLDKTLSADGRLLSSCTAQRIGAPAGAVCIDDIDCRNGTCALGQCVDVCAQTRDCAGASACTEIPISGGRFAGCLPESGNIQWSIPVKAASSTITLPVPSGAKSAQLILTIKDRSQLVGAREIVSPSGRLLYRPCNPLAPECNPEDDFYAQPIRHIPLFGQSVIVLSSWAEVPLEAGAYRLRIGSLRPTGQEGSAIPRVQASVRMGHASLLDLHFYFLNFEDHMCADQFGGSALDATRAQSEPFFLEDFVGRLRTIFSPAEISLGNLTYRDLLNHPEFDSLEIANVGSLLELSDRSTGINVFFVRSLSPVGIQAFAPSPGPAGFAGTRQSGIVIGLDTLCYRPWSDVARLTAHEIARYMGLVHNRELNETWTDNLRDTDGSNTNLMYFSEFGGTQLSPSQSEILIRSGVLRP